MSELGIKVKRQVNVQLWYLWPFYAGFTVYPITNILFRKSFMAVT